MLLKLLINNPDPGNFTDNFYQVFKEELIKLYDLLPIRQSGNQYFLTNLVRSGLSGYPTQKKTP